MRDNLGLAENLISACPACRNNFRKFWCTFTCSSDQATFLNVTATQTSQTGETAVKSVDFFVSQHFGEGFYDSCKSIQVGATNGYAMDLLGGGAKNYSAFLKFMGDEKDPTSPGSPFQINYPDEPPSAEMAAFDAIPRNCYDSDLGSRCTCIDCPNVCPSLPQVPPPSAAPVCHVGAVSCLTFVLVVAYSLVAASFLFGHTLRFAARRRKSYERVALSVDTGSERILSPRTHSQGLGTSGGSSLLRNADGDDTLIEQSETQHLGHGASLLDPIETVQPRQYRLNNYLRRMFYRLGLLTASYPWLTFAIVFTIAGLLNLGWRNFSIETDPVRLWVAPDSESKLQKEFFDEHFGPFYRPQQIFVTSHAITQTSADQKAPVLSWEHLKYWFDVEADIRELRSSPNGYTLSDVCFKPAGPDGACVVQSVAAWFGNDLDGYDPETWTQHLLDCAESPVQCLPDFQQPLSPHYVLGRVPDREDGSKAYLEAEALVITYVLSDSLDKDVQARTMEWERTLRRYLEGLDRRISAEAGLDIAWSTGVSLEEEINKSTNMDVKIVVLSYLAMFFYVALTLGNGYAGRGEEGVVSSLVRWARNLPRFFRSSSSSSTISIDSRDNPTIFPRLPRKLFVNSKFTLGLFGITLVILSVSSSVGFFSFVGVKVTLIIAEVIPFLVLAVGVDNVFILVHELDRQNLLHGPNASATTQNFGVTTPMSPTQSRSRSQFDSMHSREESVDTGSAPISLSPEERVARTLAKMGPSILLSSLTETLAFALGALVPMPAVRNFALYAAGSVLLNAILQVTVFIAALVLDLKRVEVGTCSML